MNPSRSVLLDTCLGLITRTALVFSVFLLATGHNAPGGGFIGGLVAGTAYVLQYAAGGPQRVAEALRVEPAVVLAVGLGLALLAGAGGWLWDDAFLESASADVNLGVFGTAHVTSTLVFDIGVYLVVVGLVVGMLRTIGAEEQA